MNKKIAYYLKLFKIRLKVLGVTTSILFIISVYSIFLIEIIFNKIPAVNQFLYDTGRIFLNIVYFFFSAFIFYYLIVFLPKERRKVKAFRLINNTIHLIIGQKNGLILDILKYSNPKIKAVDDNISFSEIDRCCKKVNPNRPIKFGSYFNNYDNYFIAINQRSKRIKSYINDLIAVNDLLDQKMFLRVANINNIVTESLKADHIEQMVMPDLSHLSRTIYDLHFEVVELNRSFRESFHRNYSFQYHKSERVRNKKRNEQPTANNIKTMLRPVSVRKSVLPGEPDCPADNQARQTT